MVSAAADRAIKGTDLQTKQQIFAFTEVHTGTSLTFDFFTHHVLLFIGVINSIKLSRDNNYLVSGAEDKCIKVFGIREKQELHHFADVHTGLTIASACSSESFLL